MWTELVAIVCLIALADVAVYRTRGFAGFALFFAAFPILLWIASVGCRGLAFWLSGAMLVALSAKLVWCGSTMLVAIGFALLVAFAAAWQATAPTS